MIPKLGDALSHPFRLSLCGASFPTALILLAVYGLVILICHYTKPNYRRREEHGSAHWGKIADIDRKYRQEPPESNKILTQHIAIGYDTHSRPPPRHGASRSESHRTAAAPMTRNIAVPVFLSSVFLIVHPCPASSFWSVRR